MRRGYEIRIDKLVYGGQGLGRHRGQVVFVPFSAPGDRVLVRNREVRRGYARAEILQVLEPGSGRRPPSCPYFGRCGGCHWQHLYYDRQVDAKRSILEEVFRHRFPETRDLLISMRASPTEYGYRSRARLQIQTSPKGCKVGFHRLQSHAVEEILSCPLFRPALNAALGAIRERLRATADLSVRAGIEIACSQETQTWASTVYAHHGERRADQGIPNAGPNEGEILFRHVRGFRYTVSPEAFFQANDFLLPELVGCVLELAGASQAQTAIDLYCGVGLFTLPLALIAETVTAVESSPAAALCAQNAERNGLTNIQVVQADVDAWLRQENRRPCESADLVLLNPPRAGAASGIMRTLASMKPQTIIYVSCNPQTLARDLAALREHGYRFDSVEGLDLFPQTYHFETVVCLRRG